MKKPYKDVAEFVRKYQADTRRIAKQQGLPEEDIQEMLTDLETPLFRKKVAEPEVRLWNDGYYPIIQELAKRVENISVDRQAVVWGNLIALLPKSAFNVSMCKAVAQDMKDHWPEQVTEDLATLNLYLLAKVIHSNKAKKGTESYDNVLTEKQLVRVANISKSHLDDLKQRLVSAPSNQKPGIQTQWDLLTSNPSFKASLGLKRVSVLRPSAIDSFKGMSPGLGTSSDED